MERKVVYNLRGIMEYAHRLWSAEPMSMSDRLKKAWAMAKTYKANNKVTGQFLVYVMDEADYKIMDEAITDYYASKRSGEYTGD